MTPLQLVLAGGAGFAAGGVNALAGGGTLISFPVLIALGLPPVSANVTNTVALSPGYLGGALAQRRALSGQSQRVRKLLVAAGAGGLAGSILLLFTSDNTFRFLIPILLLVAAALLALQDRLRVALKIGGPVDAPTRSDPVALVMAVSSTLGGSVGGRMAGSIEAVHLRRIMVLIGVGVAIGYAVKTYL
jgi:uncharacterized membrane protein YfcA